MTKRKAKKGISGRVETVHPLVNANADDEGTRKRRRKIKKSGEVFLLAKRYVL